MACCSDQATHTRRSVSCSSRSKSSMESYPFHRVFFKPYAGVSTAIEFVNLIVDHLTEHGTMDPARLYDTPFTNLSSRGPEGLFSQDQVQTLVKRLRDIRDKAAA